PGSPTPVSVSYKPKRFHVGQTGSSEEGGGCYPDCTRPRGGQVTSRRLFFLLVSLDALPFRDHALPAFYAPFPPTYQRPAFNRNSWVVHVNTASQPRKHQDERGLDEGTFIGLPEWEERHRVTSTLYQRVRLNGSEGDCHGHREGMRWVIII
ncbi:unnamed protein product, partial [Ectocarpus sp. 13 AM-2016]